MKPRVFVAQKVSDQVRDILQADFECDYWTEEAPLSLEELKDKAQHANGLMLSGYQINKNFLKDMPHLKVVSNVSVGYNNFDPEAMLANDVIGTHTPEVLDDTVADLILALMLATARRIAELDRYVKNGDWKSSDVENLFGLDVHHKKLGIIGMGRIGEKIAKRCKFGFDMEVSYFNRSRKPDVETLLGITYKSFDQILEESDFIVLMVPLTKETQNLMDKTAFDKMKSSAIFINGSRGGTVVEADLLDAIRSRKIWGAGLDVFVNEPIESNHGFLRQARIVTVPHIGSATAETRELMALTAAENLRDALNGKKPKYPIPEHRHLY